GNGVEGDVVPPAERQVQKQVDLDTDVVTRIPRVRADSPAIEQVGQRVKDQQHHRERRLFERAALEHEEGQQVTDGNLLKHADELDVENLFGVCVEENANGDERQRAAHGVSELTPPGVAALLPLGESERHRGTDDEHERRLDQVPEGTALPVAV